MHTPAGDVRKDRICLVPPVRLFGESKVNVHESSISPRSADGKLTLSPKKDDLTKTWLKQAAHMRRQYDIAELKDLVPEVHLIVNGDSTHTSAIGMGACVLLLPDTRSAESKGSKELEKVHMDHVLTKLGDQRKKVMAKVNDAKEQHHGGLFSINVNIRGAAGIGAVAYQPMEMGSWHVSAKGDADMVGSCDDQDLCNEYNEFVASIHTNTQLLIEHSQATNIHTLDIVWIRSNLRYPDVDSTLAYSNRNTMRVTLDEYDRFLYYTERILLIALPDKLVAEPIAKLRSYRDYHYN